MRESELERILVNETRKEGGKAYKWISPGNDGVPDRIVFFPDGKVYFVELKADRGRPRPVQLRQLEILSDLKQDAGVVRGLQGLVDFFDRVGHGEAAGRLRTRYALELRKTEGGDAGEVRAT